MPTFTSDDKVYVIDPLTTTFTPPLACADILTSYSSWGSIGGILHGIQNGNTPAVGTASSCWPANFYNHNWYPGFDVQTVGVYSPGVCPDGWGVSSSWESEAQTSAICCPSGFDAATAIVGKCRKATTGPATVDGGSGSSMVVMTPFLVYDWAMTIAWAASDQSILHPSSAPVSAVSVSPTPTSAAPSASSATARTSRSRLDPSLPAKTSGSRPDRSLPVSTQDPPQTTNTASSEPSGGLSTAAKEGIGIGAGLGALLLLSILVGLLVFRRRRRRKQAAEQIFHQDTSHPPAMQYFNGNTLEYYEKGQRSPSELANNGQRCPAEMANGVNDPRYSRGNHELDAMKYNDRPRVYQAELQG